MNKDVNLTESAKSHPIEQTPNECPSKYKNPDMFNVYGQKIDPNNQMPSIPNQEPSAGQLVHLPIDRVKSSIPKGGSDGNWLFPSPQMFWNALVRKNKISDTKEDEMETVVGIHNQMNNKTWNQILHWEELHPAASEDKSPRLLKFVGLEHDVSLKAKIKGLFGHPKPFDRHDWIVDRGGVLVRYVIDYYHMQLGDDKSVSSIEIDVRPAIDSLTAIIDRFVKMPYRILTKRTVYSNLPFFISPDRLKLLQTAQEEEERIDQIRLSRKREHMHHLTKVINTKCRHISHLGGNPDDAYFAMNVCMGQVVNPRLADEFMRSLESDDGESEKKAEELINANQRWTIELKSCIDGDK